MLTQPLRFTLIRERSQSTPEIDRAWQVATSRNPRLFDGDFLSVERFDPPGPASPGHVVCRVERYRRLAVGPALGVPVALLALTGIVTTRDQHGRTHVLMGLRGAQTRMYGGLWEFAPAGGVDVPAPGASLDDALLEAVMRQELEEEVGLDGRLLDSITPRLVAFNREACSYDIALFAEIKDGIDALRDHAAHKTWEYERVEWVPIEHLDEVRGACPPEAPRRPMVPQDEPMRAELVRLWRAESGGGATL